MTHIYDWKNLLTRWNNVFFASSLVELLDPSQRESGWLGYSGCSESQLNQMEKRLHKRLPPSYQQFLLYTNGWNSTGLFATKILNTDEVHLFRKRHLLDEIVGWTIGSVFGALLLSSGNTRGLFLPDKQYFVYGDEQLHEEVPLYYLFSALQISNASDDGVYLLNPQVATDNGEWEAWFFAPWIPGAIRYRSFWELMQAEYLNLLTVIDAPKG